eukprot:1733028-Lingulodinium_polyedra.AAC.1
MSPCPQSYLKKQRNNKEVAEAWATEVKAWKGATGVARPQQSLPEVLDLRRAKALCPPRGTFFESPTEG